MSSTQSFTTRVDDKWTKSTSYVNYGLSTSSLFPNDTAKPFRADFSVTVRRDWYLVGSPTAYGKLVCNGVEKAYQKNDSESAKTNSLTGDTSSEVVNNTRGTTTLTASVRINNSTCSAVLVSAIATYYFTRYDFSATAGSGVTSASVSSSTGYDGDTVTFSCVIPTGYAFDGWYSGNTKVSSSQSYTHTVAGADLSLTAKAHQNTHSVNGTYNGSTKAILTGISGNVGVTYNGKTKTMPTDGTEFTLGETNKAMHTDVAVGSAEPLHCAEKLLYSPLVLNYV